MIVDFDELMNQEEMLSENIRKAKDRYMECLRERAFPTPSPFGVDWEKQRVTEAYTLIARWSQGRKGNGAEGLQRRDPADHLGCAQEHVTAGRNTYPSPSPAPSHSDDNMRERGRLGFLLCHSLE